MSDIRIYSPRFCKRCSYGCIARKNAKFCLQNFCSTRNIVADLLRFNYKPLSKEFRQLQRAIACIGVPGRCFYMRCALSRMCTNLATINTLTPVYCQRRLSPGRSRDDPGTWNGGNRAH